MIKENNFLRALVGNNGLAWSGDYAFGYLFAVCQGWSRGYCSDHELAEYIAEVNAVHTAHTAAVIANQSTEDTMRALCKRYSIEIPEVTDSTEGNRGSTPASAAHAD